MWSTVNVRASQCKHTSCGRSGRAEEEDELQIWGDFFFNHPLLITRSLTVRTIKKQTKTKKTFYLISPLKSGWTSRSILRDHKTWAKKKNQSATQNLAYITRPLREMRSLAQTPRGASNQVLPASALETSQVLSGGSNGKKRREGAGLI